jgi:nucleotide-binding universal stress UspA family protein
MKPKRRSRRVRKLRRVLFATDFSAASAAAWNQALDAAHANRAALRIVHVVAPLADAQAVRWAYRELEAAMLADAEKRMQALLRRARATGVRASGLFLRGTPHEGIVRAARSNKADLIVIGTHGRTGLSRVFLGSVAARVVATAPCPVMTARSRR